MTKRKNIDFISEGAILKGWFYQPPTPANSKKGFPCVIMSHGFSALKEHALDKFAQVYAEAGFAVIVFDHPNFGESGGLPRQEVNPYLQIKAYLSAIAFAKTLESIDSENIALWGTSYSGGHVLAISAMDVNIKCVVAQVPFMSTDKKLDLSLCSAISRENFSPEIIINDCEPKEKEVSADLTINVTSLNNTEKAIMPFPAAHEFFHSIPSWKNFVTFRSALMARNYHPGLYFMLNQKIPVLFLVAKEDTMNPQELYLNIYQKASCPKEIVWIEGDHFAPYSTQFEACANASLEWYKRFL